MTLSLATLADRSLVVTEQMLAECERRLAAGIDKLSDHQLQTLTGIHAKMQSALAKMIATRTRLALNAKAFYQKLTDAEKREAMVEFFRLMSRVQQIDMIEELRAEVEA